MQLKAINLEYWHQAREIQNYLECLFWGREPLVHFDKMLVECSEKVMLLCYRAFHEKRSGVNKLSSHQKMVIQVINQSFNLDLLYG